MGAEMSSNLWSRCQVQGQVPPIRAHGSKSYNGCKGRSWVWLTEGEPRSRSGWGSLVPADKEDNHSTPPAPGEQRINSRGLATGNGDLFKLLANRNRNLYNHASKRGFLENGGEWQPGLPHRSGNLETQLWKGRWLQLWLSTSLEQINKLFPSNLRGGNTQMLRRGCQRLRQRKQAEAEECDPGAQVHRDWLWGDGCTFSYCTRPSWLCEIRFHKETGGWMRQCLQAA